MQSIFTSEKTPLICVPITATTKEQLIEQLKMITEKQPDVIEWRADFFKTLDRTDEVLEVIHYIKEHTAIPLLFTIRSEREGGEKISLSEAEKVELLEAISAETNIDFIDYEVMNERAFVEQVREVTAKNNKELILSYHHFTETPANNVLINIASRMEFFNADVAKLAVMPKSKADVHRLLSVTSELNALLNIPIITMSMGELGVISRVIGWEYGSKLTFAVGVESSAPGQVPIGELRHAIEAVQQITKYE